ncbi:restriction endonuclease [Paenibacillus sp. AN1007]|uniref:Restriction endonuclease n=1 Tax=Paenibacillus sp. AN1007 TaxID=3151385 RepID=A0AAU8N6G4_9BACL
MKINEVLAYRRPYDQSKDIIDGLPSFFHLTHKPGAKKLLLESGINKPADVNAIDGNRTPVILISSSPHKIGSTDTPWQDFFDPDNGHIRYYGDNKKTGQNPEVSRGNKSLLAAFDVQNSLDKSIRLHATPIVFFKRVSYKGKVKGNVMFQGFGMVERAERITQYDIKKDEYFTNYVFDFVVFSMKTEGEEFMWDWINARRDPAMSIKDTLRYAPESWEKWIREGLPSVEKYRRRVSKILTTKPQNQKPGRGSREEKAINEIYNFYDGSRKARFEGLASQVAQKILGSEKGSYMEGWITPSSSDGGSDFVGRLDIGSGFSKTKLVVLGQAKCEKFDTPTGGNHIARTVARLKRGWVGVYVTTSYFSEAVQREIIDDGYPIVLVHGLRVAEEVLEMVYEKGYSNVTDFLREIDSLYDEKILSRRPEEILYL